MMEAPRILLSGGGTLGPVTPLLAIAEVWRAEDDRVEFFWVGTAKGPERALVEASRIPFSTLLAPKLDRGRPWRWLFIPFFFVWSLVGAWRILREIEPDMVMSAGGYVSVPLVVIARLMGMDVWIHQLDRTIGLANRLMAPFATRISVTWDEHLEWFSQKKVIDVGGVVRPQIWEGDAQRARERFGLTQSDRPTLLLFGGGTGASSINEMMLAVGPELAAKIDVIHLTGKGKLDSELEQISDRYVALEFLGAGMADALALADVVVGRAGMGTIIELAALKKPAILIPLANTDQLGNAQMLQEREAARILYDVNPQILKQEIERLLLDEAQRHLYARRMGMLFSPRGAQRIVNEARKLFIEA